MKMNSFRIEAIAVAVLLVGGGLYFGLRPTTGQQLKMNEEAAFAKKLEEPPKRSPANADMTTERAVIPQTQEVDPFAGARGADLTEILKEYKALGQKLIMTEVERARRQEILE